MMKPPVCSIEAVVFVVLLTFISPTLLFAQSFGSIYNSDGAIRYSTYSDNVERMKNLSLSYPELVTLTTAQEEFGLPHVGVCGDKPCETHILTLTNHTSFKSVKSRPEIVISGEVHGNERVGPAAALAFVEFMCHEYESNDWLRFLINNRVVTVLPMANAIGYYKDVREEIQSINSTMEKPGESNLTVTGEKKFDPNRDFAFDQDPKQCMQTLVARTLNELFKSRIFSILLTFHAGTNALGYEWGDTSHCNQTECVPAPDSALMSTLAARMKAYAGSAGGHEEEYPIGTMGAIVYPVPGGLEDWAYGASWTSEAVKCTPTTLNGYEASRTKYSFESNRCVTYLVETSHDKRPDEDTLGTRQGIERLARGGDGDGHVPRNVRLILAAVDSVEPYVAVVNATVGATLGTAVVSWRIGGAFNVDGTHLQYGTAGKGRKRRGYGRTFSGISTLPTESRDISLNSVFRETVHVNDEPLYIRAAAVVDRKYTGRGNLTLKSTKPVSHLANLRWDSSWAYSTKMSKIHGKSIWHSPVYRLLLRDNTLTMDREYERTWGKDIQEYPESLMYRELSQQREKDTRSFVNGSLQDLGEKIESNRLAVIFTFLISLLLTICCIAYYRRRKKQRSSLATADAGEAMPLYEIGSDEDADTV